MVSYSLAPNQREAAQLLVLGRAAATPPSHLVTVETRDTAAGLGSWHHVDCDAAPSKLSVLHRQTDTQTDAA